MEGCVSRQLTEFGKIAFRQRELNAQWLKQRSRGKAMLHRYTMFFLFVAAFPVTSAAQEHWPPYTPNPSWKPLVQQAVQQYTQGNYTYKFNLVNYSVFGNYLNFDKTWHWHASSTVKFDDKGVPMINYGGTFYYNAGTVAFWALTQYDKSLGGDSGALTLFFNGLNRLLLMEDSTGAFREPFPYFYYLNGKTYQPGWVSAMSQGLALSVLARAYHLTGNTTYLNAGDQAFSFMLTLESAGGTATTMVDLDRSLFQHVFFDEYPAKPSGYTLNGLMYTLLGVYDWSQVPDDNALLANVYFNGSVDTLRHILPYYDAGGFTAYDMSHITYQKSQPHVLAGYHRDHCFLLHALVSITQDSRLKYYESLWESYVPQ